MMAHGPNTIKDYKVQWLPITMAIESITAV